MSRSEFPTPETVSTLLILVTVFHALALILTLFRLWFRYSIRRLWWDDFWAALALVCDAICMVVVWILTAPLNNPYRNLEALPTPPLSRSVHIISFWLNVLCFTCSIWFSRISIVFSVVRVVPPARSVTLTAFGAGVVLACMWAYIFSCKVVACSVNESWYDANAIQCPVPNWVALSEVITDTVSDSILVALPFRFLWRVKLPSNQRIMLLSVFSTSILVSVVSIVHTTYLIPSATFIGGVTAEVEGAVSLIVCNLLVIVTFIYRVARNGQDLTAGLADKHSEPSNRLTTVDLDVSGGSLFTTIRTAGTTVETTRMGTDTDVSTLKFAGMSDGVTTIGSIATTTGGVVPLAVSPSWGHTPTTGGHHHSRDVTVGVSAAHATPRTRGKWRCC